MDCSPPEVNKLWGIRGSYYKIPYPRLYSIYLRGTIEFEMLRLGVPGSRYLASLNLSPLNFGPCGPAGLVSHAVM